MYSNTKKRFIYMKVYMNTDKCQYVSGVIQQVS